MSIKSVADVSVRKCFFLRIIALFTTLVFIGHIKFVADVSTRLLRVTVMFKTLYFIGYVHRIFYWIYHGCACRFASGDVYLLNLSNFYDISNTPRNGFYSQI